MAIEDSVKVTLDYIKRDVAEIKARLERDYVTRDEFAPVRNIAYSIVGTIGLALLGAVIKLVLIP